MSDHARQQLLDLIDDKAFDPVLQASPDDYDSDEKKQMLRNAQ